MKDTSSKKRSCPGKYKLQGSCHRLLVALAVLAIMVGCSKRYHDLPAFSPIPFKDYENESVGRFKTSYLVDQIDTYYRGTNPGPIGIATFVNVDDLYTTSTFGRVLSEQMMSELALKGFDVVELRHSDALHFLADAGEFALSRDVEVLRRERDLGGVLVGTYAVSPVRVYVNARLIDPSTSMIVSAGTVEMSKTGEIARLLRGGGLPTTLERIPVRHLGQSTYPFYSPQQRWALEESAGYPPLPGGGGFNLPRGSVVPEPKFGQVLPELPAKGGVKK